MTKKKKHILKVNVAYSSVYKLNKNTQKTSSILVHDYLSKEIIKGGVKQPDTKLVIFQ